MALEEQHYLLLAAALLLEEPEPENIPRRRSRTPRRYWVKPWLLRRPLFGQYENLLYELHREDSKGYQNFLRMSPELFNELVERVGPLITKKDTFYRKALDPGLKIACTLRYMATGNEYSSLQYAFRVARNTISKFVPEVAEAIVTVYLDEVMKLPDRQQEWREIATGFSKKWNFHNTLGAIDGKHVAIRCPPIAGSTYYNYKQFHSIILMALVDAGYKFIFVDIGANGSCADNRIFEESGLPEALKIKSINIPPPEALPSDEQPIPDMQSRDIQQYVMSS